MFYYTYVLFFYSYAFFVFFFFKQKTAYEMRISDWSSDVCSSDLLSLVTDYKASSRLKGAQRRGLSAFLAPCHLGALFQSTGCHLSVLRGDLLWLDVGHSAQFDGRHHHAAEKDRKSTRLNSSH